MTNASDPTPLRVLYDVTNLGLGFGTDLTRTGIFRATESLVREVLAHPEIDPSFAAMESYAAEVQLARFDRSIGYLLGNRCIPVWHAGDATIDESIEILDQMIVAESEVERKRLSARIALANHLARPSVVSGAFDIYHALRFPLATRDRVAARARVITIPDMIPFLHPELSEERFVQQHRAIMQSIDQQRDWIICNSSSTRDDICNLSGISAERVAVVPLAASSRFFAPVRDTERLTAVRAVYGIGDGPYLLSLCTLEPRKNLPRLVRAFHRLVVENNFPELRLVLVGAKGWKNAELFRDLESRPELLDRVVITGFVPDADLAAVYSGAQAFLFPSLYEGFGLPALEAMQCEVPVITSNTSSLPEIVGDAAITVDPTNEDEIAGAILEILNNSARAHELVRKGVERAAQLTWKRSANETLDFYRTMLANSPESA